MAMPEKINSLTVKKLIDRGESSVVEFNPTIRDSFSLAISVAAFANTQGGIILVGIQYPGKVIGSNEKQVSHFINDLSKYLSPLIDIKLDSVDVEGKPVVIIRIPKSPQIVYADGRALKRMGGKIEAMSSDEILEKLNSLKSIPIVDMSMDCDTKDGTLKSRQVSCISSSQIDYANDGLAQAYQLGYAEVMPNSQKENISLRNMAESLSKISKRSLDADEILKELRDELKKSEKKNKIYGLSSIVGVVWAFISFMLK